VRVRLILDDEQYLHHVADAFLVTGIGLGLHYAVTEVVNFPKNALRFFCDSHCS
jgi:hypothetical protein